MTLFKRLVWARANLSPVQSRYRVVYEDPAEPDAPCKVLIPDPNFMAAALHGGILAPIEAVHAVEYDRGRPTNYHVVHEAPPLPAMTEEQAIEYLIKKDIPRRVWGGKSNRPRFKICTIEQLPSREYRNAWRLAA